MKNKLDKFESMLEKAFFEEDSLSEDLVNKTRIKLHNKESETMKSNNHSPLKWVAAVIIGLVLTGITAFASWQLLTPSEVASEFEREDLALAFDSEDAIHINESMTSRGYIFTLVSIVRGEYLSGTSSYITINGEAIRNDRTYAVMTVQQEDGTSMSESYHLFDFFTSPYVHGFNPFHLSSFVLGGGHFETVIDGVLYLLIDMNNIEVFADHGVYVGINSGRMHSINALNFDEVTGAITVNPDFSGLAALFRLPLDPSWADEVRAQEILDRAPFPVAVEEEEIEDEEELLEQGELVEDTNEFACELEFEYCCDIEFEYFKSLTHDQLDEIIFSALEVGNYSHCVFDFMQVGLAIRERETSMNYMRLNSEGLYDFFEAIIERDIEAGLYGNIIESWQRDRGLMLRRMYNYNIPYFVIWYCDEGSMIIMEGHPFDWLLND